MDRRIFNSQEIYAQELEQIFGRSWLFVAHENQIANPNDFVANYMAEDPVLVTRDSKGKLHTFLNMCLLKLLMVQLIVNKNSAVNGTLLNINQAWISYNHTCGTSKVLA